MKTTWLCTCWIIQPLQEHYLEHTSQTFSHNFAYYFYLTFYIFIISCIVFQQGGCNNGYRPTTC